MFLWVCLSHDYIHVQIDTENSLFDKTSGAAYLEGT